MPAALRRVLPPLWLLGLAALACANAFPDEFIVDSRPIVAEHELLRADSPWWRLFQKTYWGDLVTGGLYRPVTMLSFRVERNLLGFTDPAAHAAVNVALHAIVVLLLWRLALQWSAGRVAAVVGASFFAVHPVVSEVVPNLVGRADLIMAAGVLAALLCWERAYDAPPRAAAAWAGAAIALWLLALLAKESAVAFPVLAFTREWWRRGEQTDAPRPVFTAALRTAGNHLPRYGTLAVALAAWWAVHVAVSRQAPPFWNSALINPLVEAGPAERVMTAAVVLARYLIVAVAPVRMSADHSGLDVPLVSSPIAGAFLASAAVLAAYAALTAWAWRRSRPAAMGLTFAAAAILPVANVFFLIGTIMAERLLYLPLAGLSLAAGVAGAWAWSWARRRGVVVSAAAAAVALVLLGALLGRAWQRNAVWRTDESFWRAALADAPRSYKPHLVFAERALAAGDASAAVDHAEEAVELASPLPLAYRAELLLTAARARLALAAAGDEAEARRHRRRAIELADMGLEAYLQTPARQRLNERLVEHFRRRGLPTAAIDEGIVQLYFARAEACHGLEDWAGVADAIGAALTYRPNEPALREDFARFRALAAEIADR